MNASFSRHSDEAILADLLDQFVETLMDGKPVDPASALPDRPDLRDRVREAYELASSIVARSRDDSIESEATDASAAEPKLPIDELGGYRLIRRIGAGGMGVVYLAEEHQLHRLVALKLIHRGLQASDNARRRFEREAQAVGRLRHPNIVTVFAAGESDGVQFLAMELVPGRGLDVVLRERASGAGATSGNDLVAWCRDIARALAYAHEAGVVHRDVKPANVRITPEGRAMLLDFGLALALDEETYSQTGSFHGSPHYASPEQIRGQPTGRQTDVYSLGVTLYECLSGQLPFRSANTEELFHRILSSEARPLRKLNGSVSRDLEAVVAKAMEKDPKRRYQSAAELADDLDALLAFRPVRARLPGLQTRSLRWARRNRALAVTAALALVATVMTPVSLIWESEVRAAARNREAEALVSRARQGVAHYRRLRKEWRPVSQALASVRVQIERHYVAATAYPRLRGLETSVAGLALEQETLYLETLEQLVRANRLGADTSVTDEVRADLYLERWLEASDERPDPEKPAQISARRQRMEFYRDLVEKYDPHGRHSSTLRGQLMGVVVTSKPPGAEIFGFRYEEQSQLFPHDGENRLVPVPMGGKVEALPVRPGRRSLRVVVGSGPLHSEDLILDLAGHPVGRSVFVTDREGRVSRLVSVDGRPMARTSDFRLALRAKETARERTFVLETRAGRQRLRGSSLDAIGLTLHSPASLAGRGGVRARVYQSGRVTDLVLPQGLVVRPTAAPVLLGPASRLGRAPLARMALRRGEYLFVARAEGCETVRSLVRLFTETTHCISLPRAGTVPAGFVACQPTQGYARVCVQEHETTCEEYLEFLNDPATLARIDASKDPILMPRSSSQQVASWPRGSDGRYHLPDGCSRDLPVVGVSFYDAQAYAAWFDRRAAAAGSSWRFELPTEQSWCAAFVSYRLYAYGDRFRPAWFSSAFARPNPLLEPVLSYPIDETPYGVYDMTGSVFEWLDLDKDDQPGKVIAAGAWSTGNSTVFRLQHQESKPPELTSDNIGFRLVAVVRR